MSFNKVKIITLIELIKESHYTFYTDNGSYKVKTVNVPLPISSIVKNWIICFTRFDYFSDRITRMILLCF